MKSENDPTEQPYSVQNEQKVFSLDDFMNEVSSQGSHQKNHQFDNLDVLFNNENLDKSITSQQSLKKSQISQQISKNLKKSITAADIPQQSSERDLKLDDFGSVKDLEEQSAGQQSFDIDGSNHQVQSPSISQNQKQSENHPIEKQEDLNYSDFESLQQSHVQDVQSNKLNFSDFGLQEQQQQYQVIQNTSEVIKLFPIVEGSNILQDPQQENQKDNKLYNINQNETQNITQGVSFMRNLTNDECLFQSFDEKNEHYDFGDFVQKQQQIFNLEDMKQIYGDNAQEISKIEQFLDFSPLKTQGKQPQSPILPQSNYKDVIEKTTDSPQIINDIQDIIQTSNNEQNLDSIVNQLQQAQQEKVPDFNIVYIENQESQNNNDQIITAIQSAEQVYEVKDVEQQQNPIILQLPPQTSIIDNITVIQQQNNDLQLDNQHSQNTQPFQSQVLVEQVYELKDEKQQQNPIILQIPPQTFVIDKITIKQQNNDLQLDNQYSLNTQTVESQVTSLQEQQQFDALWEPLHSFNPQNSYNIQNVDYFQQNQKSDSQSNPQLSTYLQSVDTPVLPYQQDQKNQFTYNSQNIEQQDLQEIQQENEIKWDPQLSFNLQTIQNQNNIQQINENEQELQDQLIEQQIEIQVQTLQQQQIELQNNSQNIQLQHPIENLDYLEEQHNSIQNDSQFETKNFETQLQNQLESKEQFINFNQEKQPEQITDFEKIGNQYAQIDLNNNLIVQSEQFSDQKEIDDWFMPQQQQNIIDTHQDIHTSFKIQPIAFTNQTQNQQDQNIREDQIFYVPPQTFGAIPEFISNLPNQYHINSQIQDNDQFSQKINEPLEDLQEKNDYQYEYKSSNIIQQNYQDYNFEFLSQQPQMQIQDLNFTNQNILLDKNEQQVHEQYEEVSSLSKNPFNDIESDKNSNSKGDPKINNQIAKNPFSDLEENSQRLSMQSLDDKKLNKSQEQKDEHIVHTFSNSQTQSPYINVLDDIEQNNQYQISNPETVKFNKKFNLIKEQTNNYDYPKDVSVGGLNKLDELNFLQSPYSQPQQEIKPNFVRKSFQPAQTILVNQNENKSDQNLNQDENSQNDSIVKCKCSSSSEEEVQNEQIQFQQQNDKIKQEIQQKNLIEYNKIQTKDSEINQFKSTNQDIKFSNQNYQAIEANEFIQNKDLKQFNGSIISKESTGTKETLPAKVALKGLQTDEEKSSPHVFSLEDFEDNTGITGSLIKQSLVKKTLPVIKEEENESLHESQLLKKNSDLIKNIVQQNLQEYIKEIQTLKDQQVQFQQLNIQKKLEYESHIQQIEQELYNTKHDFQQILLNFQKNDEQIIQKQDNQVKQEIESKIENVYAQTQQQLQQLKDEIVSLKIPPPAQPNPQKPVDFMQEIKKFEEKILNDIEQKNKKFLNDSKNLEMINSLKSEITGLKNIIKTNETTQVKEVSQFRIDERLQNLEALVIEEVKTLNYTQTQFNEEIKKVAQNQANKQQTLTQQQFTQNQFASTQQQFEIPTREHEDFNFQNDFLQSDTPRTPPKCNDFSSSQKKVLTINSPLNPDFIQTLNEPDDNQTDSFRELAKSELTKNPYLKKIYKDPYIVMKQYENNQRLPQDLYVSHQFSKSQHKSMNITQYNSNIFKEEMDFSINQYSKKYIEYQNIEKENILLQSYYQPIIDVKNLLLGKQVNLDGVFYQQQLSSVCRNSGLDVKLFKHNILSTNIILCNSFDFLVTAKYQIIDTQLDEKLLKITITYENKIEFSLKNLIIIFFNQNQGNVNVVPSKINKELMLPHEKVKQEIYLRNFNINHQTLVTSVTYQQEFIRDWDALPLTHRFYSAPQFLNSPIISSVEELKNVFQCVDLHSEFEQSRVIWKEIGLKFYFINENQFTYLMKIYYTDDNRLFFEVGTLQTDKIMVSKEILNAMYYIFCEQSI